MVAPYLKSAAIFKCPADKSYVTRGSTLFPRVRSCSMNEYVGDPTNERGEVSRLSDPFYAYHFYKPDDFLKPGPSETYVLLEEHEDSINDGHFLLGGIDVRSWGWNDLPACRHRRSANFAFADGHVQKHMWRDPRTFQPVKRNRQHGLNQPNNPDVHWMVDHATAPK